MPTVTAGNCVLISSGKRCRIANEGAEGPDIEERHDPGVPAADDGELSLIEDLALVRVVHEEHRAAHRNDDRQDPHQAGVLEIDARNRCRPDRD